MSLDLSAEDRKALAKDLAAELDTGRYGSRFVLSRRQLLTLAGGSAGVAGLVALGVDPATAQSAAGQVGTSSEPVDTFAYDLDVQGALQRDLDAGGQAIENVGSVSTDEVNTVRYLSPSDDVQSVVNAEGDNTTFVFESGTWDATGGGLLSLTGSQNIDFIGQGANTVIEYNGGSAIGLQNCSDIRISNIEFNGVNIGGSSVEKCVVALESDRIWVDNTRMFDVGNDAILFADDTHNCVASNNHIDGSTDDCINLGGNIGQERDCRQLIAYGNTALNPTNTCIHISDGAIRSIAIANTVSGGVEGIDVWNANDSIIANNTITDCNDGIKDNGPASNIQIVNNYIDNCRRRGIEYRRDDATISGNVISGIEREGIAVSGTGIMVHNNIVLSTGQSTDADFSGISCTGEAIRISGNWVESTGDRGIEFNQNNSASDQAVCSGNIVKNVPSDGIFSFESQGLLVFGNSVRSATGNAITTQNGSDNVVALNSVDSGISTESTTEESLNTSI